MQMVVKCGHNIVLTKPVVDCSTVKTRWEGNIEESRKEFVGKISKWAVSLSIMGSLTYKMSKHVLAATSNPAAEHIRSSFFQIFDVFTAISEPILWFYALTGCILMVTKSKDSGLTRLKQVGYSYAAIELLPTFFSFLRWISHTLRDSISF